MNNLYRFFFCSFYFRLENIPFAILHLNPFQTMKQLATTLRQLGAAVLCAAALSSCSHREYAMLPKTPAYHGEQHRAVAAQPAAPIQEAAPAVAPEPAPAAPAAPATSAAPAKAEAVAKAPAATAKTEAVAAAPAAKVNFAQKALVAKALKKVDKLAAKAQVKKHSNAASADDANALAKNLRLGIILLLIGVLLSAVFGGILGLLGYIFAIVGIVLIVLGLLDAV
jgi:hypothetical protein